MTLGIYTSADLMNNNGEQAEGDKGQVLLDANREALLPEATVPVTHAAVVSTHFSYQDAPSCRCGTLMIRTGSCYTCPSCGENLGSCS